MKQSPYLSIVEDACGLLGRDLMDGPLRCRKPLRRRKRAHSRISQPARTDCLAFARTPIADIAAAARWIQ